MIDKNNNNNNVKIVILLLKSSQMIKLSTNGGHYKVHYMQYMRNKPYTSKVM